MFIKHNDNHSRWNVLLNDLVRASISADKESRPPPLRSKPFPLVLLFSLSSLPFYMIPPLPLTDTAPCRVIIYIKGRTDNMRMITPSCASCPWIEGLPFILFVTNLILEKNSSLKDNTNKTYRACHKGCHTMRKKSS